MGDLVQWLRAQIAADRDRALGALRGYPMSMTRETWAKPDLDRVGADTADAQHWRSHQDRLYQVDDPTSFVGDEIATFPQGPLRAAFVAAHGPQAVLAQCEAHTAILDRYDRVREAGSSGRYTEWELAQVTLMEELVNLVGLAYQHHPGYREGWRP